MMITIKRTIKRNTLLYTLYLKSSVSPVEEDTLQWIVKKMLRIFIIELKLLTMKTTNFIQNTSFYSRRIDESKPIS